MTATGPALYCRTCGTALAPGGSFCTRCGTNSMPAPVAAACPRCGVAAAPGTTFCRACGASLGAAVPPPSPPTPGGPIAASAGWGTAPPTFTGLGRRGRIPAIAKFGAVAVVLVVIGSIAASISRGSPSRCVYACAPQAGVAQPNGNLYRSAYGFSFAYPSNWSESRGNATTAEFEERSGPGSFVVQAGNGTPTLAALLQDGAKVVSANLQQASAIGSLPGAALGAATGAGALYGGILAVNGQQAPWRIAVIAGELNGHWAVLIGSGPLENGIPPTGVEDGAAIDDVLTQWTWTTS